MRGNSSSWYVYCYANQIKPHQKNLQKEPHWTMNYSAYNILLRISALDLEEYYDTCVFY